MARWNEKRQRWEFPLERSTESTSGLSPCRDPDIPHPGMVFYAGRWRSEESVERDRVRMRAYKKERRQTDPEYKQAEREKRYQRKKRRLQSDPTYRMLHNIKNLQRYYRRANRRDEERLNELAKAQD